MEQEKKLFKELLKDAYDDEYVILKFKILKYKIIN